MEKYRSGHNEAVLKTVCPKGRVGSNPTFSAKGRAHQPKVGVLFLLLINDFSGLFFLLHFSQSKIIKQFLFVSIDNLLTISEKSLEITRFLWYYIRVVKK